MSEIKVINGNFERALRQFKKLSLPILKELKDRRSFQSKVQKRKRKDAASRRRKKRLEKRMNQLRLDAKRIS